jgi:L-ascorbate metabolism protein UlaG (beta-lactamase superfamily)
LALSGCGGLRPHRDLLIEHGAESRRGSVQVTSLGANAFFIEAGDTRLLVDPFFSRPGWAKIAFGPPIPSHEERVKAVLVRLPEKVDGILITHAHYDHLMDVPAVRARVGGALIASEAAFRLVSAEGEFAKPGDVLRIGGATIHVLEAAHDTICGILPFPGDVYDVRQVPPRKASDDVCGQPLAFLIEVEGKSHYVDSGGTTAVRPPERPQGTDLAILGVALSDGRERLVPAIQRLRPRIVVPSHQDNYFRPLDKPYRFNAGTNMRDVRRRFEASGSEGRLVLMDFFDTLSL